MPLLQFRPEGIYCADGDFYIDPWRPVDKALITHAHADHSRWGMKNYLAHHDSIPVMQHRLGSDIHVQGIEYGEEIKINGVSVAYFPAGHIIGSSQIRVRHGNENWVVSGDYKLDADSSCVPFEPVQCDHFVTESTFGLPIFRWEAPEVVFAKMNAWWRSCQERGKSAVLCCYSLGKAQRILKGLKAELGPIYTHGAIENMNEVLRENGMELPKTILVTADTRLKGTEGAIVLAPPSALGTSWMNRFKPFETAIASGWMQVRGLRRRRNADTGFVLSDHADWEGLNKAVLETGAENIYVTHGYQGVFSQWLKEQGLNAQEVVTEYGEEKEEAE